MKKKIFLTILGIIIIYADVAFAIKAGIGVMPVDAAINTIAALASSPRKALFLIDTRNGNER